MQPGLDLYPTLAQGMGPDLHWFPEDVPLARLSATLAAMANTAGGAVILGVSPRSGHVQGVQVPADTLDRVFQAALMVEPPLVIPLPKVQRVEESQVVWVTIPAGLPHVYSVEGRFLWREGAQSNPLPARELRRLLMERGVIQFETRVPPGATLANLDGDQVEAYAQTYRSILHLREGQEGPASQEILLRRGCLQQEGDLLQPAYSALLLFGSHPQRWLPTATILAARFSGTGFADRFVKQDITGSLPEQLRQAESFVKSNLQSVVRLVGLTHQETLEYPLEAVRELLVNAAAHRDYNAQGDSIHLNIFSDRLEVTSPGSLPGPVTLDNLLKARFSRNPIIVQLLSDLGFVERLGYGLDRVVSIMRQSGLRPPRFEELAGSFRVTLFNAPLHDVAPPEIAHYRSLDLNPRQEAALNFLLTQRRITNSDYQELCPEVHPESLRRDLADLVSRGVLIKIGDKRATYYILK
ncbi:MAG TPA: ATP-binding protein [Anaerolineales bacterium]|nr:ATP-binding protein [Anaerolineales bacterium]